MSYLTLSLPFSTSGTVAGRLLSTAWLFKIASHRLLNVTKFTPVLPGSDIGWKNMFRKLVYGVIPNRRYADGVIALVRSIYESCRALGVDFKSVELGGWLMFQQAEREYPARNITLKPGHEFHITTLDYSGNSYRDTVKPTVPKRFKPLLDAVLEERQEYTARVVIKGSGERRGVLWVRGEVQVTIPVEFYYEYTARRSTPSGELVAGVDVNVDRINIAIVDNYGRLRDVKTFWFEEAGRKSVRRRRARSIIGMRIHEVLKYLVSHGVETVVLENPSVLGKLKLLWIRNGDRKHENYNYKVSVFRSSVVEMVAMKAPLYGLKTAHVDPGGTTSSPEHETVMREYGLDKHTTSAYLVALKHLQNQRI